MRLFISRVVVFSSLSPRRSGIWDSDRSRVSSCSSADGFGKYSLISGLGDDGDTNKSREFQESFHSPRRYQINPPFCISLPFQMDFKWFFLLLSTSLETFYFPSFFECEMENEERSFCILIYWWYASRSGRGGWRHLEEVCGIEMDFTVWMWSWNEETYGIDGWLWMMSQEINQKESQGIKENSRLALANCEHMRLRTVK